MQFTIVGAGAIGGTLGAYLVRGGEAVRFIDHDAAHVQAINERGLTIRGFDQTFTVKATATTPETATGPIEVLLLAVKAQHTSQALGAVQRLLGPDSCVVSLQNGLCERIIADLIGPARTIGCFVNFSADYLEPGVIAYGGPGALYLGELDGVHRPRLDALRLAFAHWGEATLTDNIWGYLWGKLGYANMLFATALADETMAEVIDRYRPLMVELAGEVYAVAAREGVQVQPFDAVEPSLYYPRTQRDPRALETSLDALVARRRRDLKSKSGIWRDLAVRHRRTEVDQQIGLVAEIGASHGMALPLTQRLVAMIHELEDGRRTMSWANLQELEVLRAANYEEVLQG